MNLRTFRGPTMAQVLAQVKIAMGQDAIIYHTRTVHKPIWLGLRKQELFEITAGRAGNGFGHARKAPSLQPARILNGRGPTDAATMFGRQLLDTPLADRIFIRDLTGQVQTIKSMVSDLAKQVQHQQKPQVPQELFDCYRQLVSNQVDDDLAVQTITTLHRQIRPEHMQQPAFVKEKLAEIIEKMVPTTGPIRRSKMRGPHVVALIGPTGVGKTTTIAKLAANLKLREKRRVGLITIDTYRIAAIDQLKKYADIIGSNLRIVGSAEDMCNALESMNDSEFVLIDTAGRSPNDALKLQELRSFLARAAPDEVHLVLSATSDQECVARAIERFADARVDRMIFTKLDEAPHAGLILNVLRKVQKPLSYLTTGQDVPDDIEVARGRRLAQLILGSSL